MAFGGANSPAVDDTGAARTTANRTTPPLFVKANRVTNTTVLAVAAAKDATQIRVASVVGVNVGDYTGLFSVATGRFYVGTVLQIIDPGVSNILEMDTPLDSAFAVGDTVGTGVTNLASIDGALGAPAIYSIRGADPGVAVTVDITRILISCLASSAVDLSKFGNLPKLTNGLVVRRVDGLTFNQINYKDNRELAGAMFDWAPFSAANPQQGVDGFVCRLTYSGEGKLATTITLAPGENLQFLVQDPLFTDGLDLLEIMVEGNVRPVQ